MWLRVIENKGNPLYWSGLFVLWVASLLYRVGLWLRLLFIRGGVKIHAPVVSVGNLTVGGSGKTPTAIYLSHHFLSKGKKTCIVSSGYGRKNSVDSLEKGADFFPHAIDNVGDEVMMMAECLPDACFAVSESKGRAALLADEKYTPDMVIVDDGYQHLKLHRDFNILLIDAGIDLRKESLFPLGRRREPLAALRRADAVIITKSNMVEMESSFRRWIGDRFREKIVAEVEFINEMVISSSERLQINSIADRSIYFYAGIGDFNSLVSRLKKRFRHLVGHRRFPDHCPYRASEATRINADIEKLRPDYILTTHKDYVKTRNFDFGQPIYYLDLQLRFVSGEKELLGAIENIASKKKWRGSTIS
ncbi:MAG: tetraacyldisaccharide 4'-kinase [Candidatus Zixiibacteriota bacterium]|nr:MAG: tetraacyldisaccharide 4'-kinase [candidate division Zixibacteria bacterium]